MLLILLTDFARSIVLMPSIVPAQITFIRCHKKLCYILVSKAPAWQNGWQSKQCRAFNPVIQWSPNYASPGHAMTCSQRPITAIHYILKLHNTQCHSTCRPQKAGIVSCCLGNRKLSSPHPLTPCFPPSTVFVATFLLYRFYSYDFYCFLTNFVDRSISTETS